MELRGERVRLRPLRPEELDAVWSSRSVTHPHMPARARKSLERRLANSGKLVDGWLDLAVEVEGRLVGDIGARCPRGALPPGVLELGIDLFEGERGKGYGREAVSLLTSYLFESGLAERVQASTSLANAAMRRVFERLGFLEEGIMRSFMPGEDGREDYVLYAVTREDWT